MSVHRMRCVVNINLGYRSPRRRSFRCHPRGRWPHNVLNREEFEWRAKSRRARAQSQRKQRKLARNLWIFALRCVSFETKMLEEENKEKAKVFEVRRVWTKGAIVAKYRLGVEKWIIRLIFSHVWLNVRINDRPWSIDRVGYSLLKWVTPTVQSVL